MAQSNVEFNNMVNSMRGMTGTNINNGFKNYFSGYTSMNTEPKVFTSDDGYGNMTYHIISSDGKIKRRYVEHRGKSNPNETEKIIKGIINEIRSQSPTFQDIKNKMGIIDISNPLPIEKDFFIPSPNGNKSIDIENIDYESGYIGIGNSSPSDRLIIENKPIKRNYVNHNIQEIPKHIEPEKKSIFKNIFK